EGGFQMEYLGGDDLVSRHALVQEVLGLPERHLSTSELAQDPPGVPEVRVGPGSEIQHPMRIIGILQMLGNADGQLGEVNRLGGILEACREALFEQELAKPPSLKALVGEDQSELIVEGELYQGSEQLVGFRPLKDSDSLVPVTDFLLEPANFLVRSPAVGAAFEKMRDDLSDKLIVAQIASQQLRHGFE